MDRKLVGYEFKSQDAFDAEMQNALASGDASQLPVRAAPVYADGQGNRWSESPGPDGITRTALPSSTELDSTPKRRKAPEIDPRLAMYKGGFVPAADDLQPSGGWSDPASNRPGSGDYVDAAKMPLGVSGVVASSLPGMTNGGWAGGLGGGDEDGLGLDQLMGGMASQLPPEQALSWLGDTAARAMTAAAPGGMLDTTMKALGLTNPLAGGPLGDALGAALKSAGLDGTAGGMLGTLMNRRASGLASQLGSSVVNQALGMAGLGDLPGMGALSGLAGGALGNFAGGAINDIAGGVVGDLLKNGASGAAASLLGGIGGGAGGLADLMTTGGFAGPLGDATGAFDDIMGGCFPGGDSGMADLSDLTSGGCFDPNAGAGLDLNDLGSKGLDKAVDHMMSEWKVDDESSAAEHIAHKMVSENLADLKSLAKDELLGGKGGGLAGLADKIKKFFTGEAPGTGQPAIRMGDLDDQANLCITGIANIKFEGQPVARRTDTVAGPTAPAPKPIVIGEPTVISAGMENAFVLAPAAVPSKMAAKGATTILVGGAVVAALQEAAKKEAEAKANAAPKAPAGPASTASGSAAEGQEGAGKSPDGEAGSETTGDKQKNDSKKAGSQSTEDTGKNPDSTEAGDEDDSASADGEKEDASSSGEPTSDQSNEASDGENQEQSGQEAEEPGVCEPDPPPSGGECHREDGVYVEGDWHKRLVIIEDGKVTTYEAGPDNVNIFDAKLESTRKNHRPGALESDRIDPPPGMTHEEFLNRVRGAAENAHYNSGTSDYSVTGGEGAAKGTQNSNRYVRDILEDAGHTGNIPSSWPAPGLNAPKPSSPTGHLPTHMDPKDAPPGTLEKPGQTNSPKPGSFTVDPKTGRITYG